MSALRRTMHIHQAAHLSGASQSIVTPLRPSNFPKSRQPTPVKIVELPNTSIVPCKPSLHPLAPACQAPFAPLSFIRSFHRSAIRGHETRLNKRKVRHIIFPSSTLACSPLLTSPFPSVLRISTGTNLDSTVLFDVRALTPRFATRRRQLVTGVICLTDKTLLTTAATSATNDYVIMGAFGNLIPLVVLFLVVAGMGWVGYQVQHPIFLRLLFEIL